MSDSLSGRQMLMLWTAVLLGPIAWAVSLSSMFWLTHPVCRGSGHELLWTVGSVCTVLALAPCIGASLALARRGSPPEQAGTVPFMLRLAIGASAMSALVILLSMVPIAMLTPCRV